MAMLWIDRLEKLGRLLLWLAIASAMVILPVAFTRHGREQEKLREALQNAEAQLADALKPKKPDRLTFKSMGMFLSALNRTNSNGEVWFTNLSPQAGVVCLQGAVANPDTKAITTSLAACREVGAYASEVHMTMMFAGKNLADTCGKSACQLMVMDASRTDEK
jgi:hypothetical protein